MKKTVKFIVTAALVVILGMNTYAQMDDHSTMSTSKSEIIKVSGNCSMCKARIEKAAKIEGVSKADWSDKTKILTLVYDPSKVTSSEVQNKIAAAGHDTELVKATDKAYTGLPECCQYR